jgi:hypothetical protein
MKSTNIEIPILFIIFRRKESAIQVINEISKVKPKKLYISQDGPRNDEDRIQIAETRKAVLSKINWDCKLTLWTHKTNLGPKAQIPQALDRLFKEEEWGIYLEDDTLPSENFFYFQQDLLRKYKDDKRVFSINGTNFYPDLIKPEYSYYPTRIGEIWGFGLWKRSWKLYKSNIKDLEKVAQMDTYKSYFFSNKYRFYLEGFWKAIINGKLNSWAMQLVYAAAKNNMYFLAPSVNLVNNIGDINSATHVSLQKYTKDFGNPYPLKHPNELKYNKNYDKKYFDQMLKGGWLRIMLIRTYLLLPDFLKKTAVFLTKRALYLIGEKNDKSKR